MTTIWTMLATLTLIVAAISFVGIMYPIRSLSEETRKSAGLVLVVSCFLMIFALHSAYGDP